jgi:hypothetical protein
MSDIAPDIDAWARAHDFAPVDWSPSGETPLLREGMLDIAADSYTGQIAGHDAILCEFSVGSPDASEAFGGGGTDSSWFTLFLIGIDDQGYRRLTIHPSSIADRDWWNRLLGRDHRLAIGDAAFDDRHQLITSSDLDQERFEHTVARFRDTLESLPDLLVEIERSEDGETSLLAALPGIGIGDDRLGQLRDATAQLLADL